MRMWRVGIMVAAAILGGISGAAAQPEVPRYEAGVQVSVLRLSDFGSTNTGIGGRFSFNLSRWAALEAEGSFFPQDDIALPPTALFDNFRVRHYRKRVEGFFGARLGYRGERFGLFAKARPGFTSLSERNGGDMCEGEVCALVLLVRPEYRTEFALDLGGIFEFYPSRRVVARFELGDTIIRHRSDAPPCWGGECTSNNVSSKFGIGFRF
jgi:hypothetical protein